MNDRTIPRSRRNGRMSTVLPLVSLLASGAGAAGAAPPQGAPSGDPAAVEETAPTDDTARAALPPEVTAPSYPSLHIIGFTDINFRATDHQPGAASSGFFEGQFVLHFTSALSSRFTFFAETTLTARPEAAVDAHGPGFNAEVERSILKYTHSDWLQVSLGRYHTPISYWNTAFHHGQWLQSTMGRPEMIQFGGQFLPVHFVGALAEGTLPAAGLNLGYSAGLGNGRSTVISRAGDAEDVNGSRAWLVGLYAKPDHPFGLQAGGAVYRDRISPADSRGESQGELILTAHLAWTKETPEVLAEYAHVRHEDGHARACRNRAYYVQVAYRLSMLGARLKPYARWEDFRIDPADAIFAELTSKHGYLVGLRFDASELVAVKAEYRHQSEPGAVYRNGAFAQASFTF